MRDSLTVSLSQKYLLLPCGFTVSFRSGEGDWGIAMALPDDWQSEGMCRGSHSHLFFPQAYFEQKDARERREHRAKSICQVCPVLDDCADFALSVKEAYGIWGGMTESDRKKIYAA